MFECLCVGEFVWLGICVSGCLYVCVFVFLHVCVSVCLDVRAFVCLCVGVCLCFPAVVLKPLFGHPGHNLAANMPQRRSQVHFSLIWEPFWAAF